MKRTTILSFAVLLALMCLSGLSVAQQTLTVYDGTATSTCVPVRGMFCDSYQKCEFVIPSSDLTEMNGGTVSQMTFYLSDPANEAWNGSFQVFLKEVSGTSISSFSGSTGASVVYIGTLDATGSTMTIEFSNDYTYNGGNLLVGFYQHTIGNYKYASFYGESVSGASIQGQSSNSLDEVVPTQYNFIPKTTFTYSGGGANEWNFGDAMAYCGENATADGLCGLSSTGAAAVKYPASLMAGRNYLRSVFINIPDYNITDFTLRICQEEVNGEPQTSASIFTHTYSWNYFTPGWVELPTPGCVLDDNKPLWVIFEIAVTRYVETGIYEGNAQLVHQNTGWMPISEISSGYSGWSNSMWAFYAVTSATEPVYPDSDVLDLPFTCGFEEDENLDCWTFIDADEDGCGWEEFTNSHSGTYSYYSASYENGYGPLTPDNWMITPKLHIPGSGATLKWWDYADDNSDYEEHYSVLVSTTGKAISNFTGNLFETTLTAGQTWTQRSVSLSSYAGQDIYLAFRHYDCTDQFRLIIDDISVTAGNNGIDNYQLSTLNSQLSIHPNPATDVVNVSAEALREVSLLDLNGRLLATSNAPRIDLSGIEAGVYFLRIVTDNGVTMRKIVKK